MDGRLQEPFTDKLFKGGCAGRRTTDIHLLHLKQKPINRHEPAPCRLTFKINRRIRQVRKMVLQERGVILRHRLFDKMKLLRRELLASDPLKTNT
ncbi:hypothetical protein D3C81_1876810 [compost metagenome]